MASPPMDDEKKVPMTGSSHRSVSSGSTTVPASKEEAPKDLSKLDSAVVAQASAAATATPGHDHDKQDALYAHLPAGEADILRRQIELPTTKTTWATLYRFATRNDQLVMGFSAFAAIAAGAAMPLMTIVFGGVAGEFSNFFQGKSSRAHYDDVIVTNVLYLIYIAIATFVFTYLATVGFIYAGEHMAAKIRREYLAACLRQNIGFYDKLGAGEITTRITADTNLVQDGISEKVALTLTALATFVTAFVIGFIKDWKLTLILASTVVAIVVAMGSMSGYAMRHTKAAIEAYAVGGSVVEEVISSVRNAVAFGTQEKLAKQYDVHLARAEREGRKGKGAQALMIGMLFMIIFWNYGLAFWEGSRLYVESELALSDILTILMAIMIGAFSLGNVAPNLSALTTSIAAAGKIFNTIDRVSPLDSAADSGDILPNVEGHVELRNVKHIYPSRPEVVVMRDVSLLIPAGKKTALVGASGSGKSTIIGLVERFYSPVAGQVFLDGRDVSTLNLKWLRRQISLVSQEPTLFGTTIYNNIRHGLIGTRFDTADQAKTKELVIGAAKMANAHDFISALPEGYDTKVGERGLLLSGGQRQRIAIARAVVSDPKILLLDEATSALDTKSEGVVQAALEVAATGRTTITIAHRLSTIRDADNIVVMADGCIIEQGTHNDLLAKQGAYFKLVEAQAIAATMELSKTEEQEIDAHDDKLIREKSQHQTEVLPQDPDDVDIVAKLNRSTTQKSQSSLALNQRKADGEQQDSLWSLIKLVATFNKAEWPWMVFGLFWSIIAGGGNPVGAVFFAKSINYLSIPVTDDTRHTILHNMSFWALMYFMTGWVMLISYCAQGIAFAYCAEKLIYRVRARAFRTILRQDIEFFDREENTAGALTSFLSTETTHVAGLSGVTLGTILTVVSTLVSACALSLAIGWKLALVCISTIPVLLACGFFRFWMLSQFQRRAKKAYGDSASYACEATSAIRTVASLTREQDVLDHYSNSLKVQCRKSLISVSKTSLLYAMSQSGMYLCLALGFWYGGQRIGDGEYTMFQFFVCFMAVIFGAQSAGTIFSFAPDMGKAKQAAQEFKTLYDRKPLIDTWSTEGKEVPAVSGSVEFRDVHFRYPTRPDQPVLRGLNLTVAPGQYVALVGASGCGKSTTIALLERFYDPLTGAVFVDGEEISTLNVNTYRSSIALVSQEPTLYQGTIRENIVLGVHRPSVSDEELEAACREANIYEFITSLPEGFETLVGSKGTMLSGGQKQRVAIARALLRDPKILLLDEATSALDSESEHVVQAALDKAAKGRTTIAVAHRLSTIQKADIIYVFDQGVIVESGTHSELMNKGGRYSELVNLQSLGRN